MSSGTPQVVDVRALAVGAQDLGAQWSLSGDRELEANVVHIPAGEGIAEHLGGVDVMVMVVTGEGSMQINAARFELRTDVLVFVPRGSTRSFRAGVSGLTYVTVHRRREEGLAMGPTRVQQVQEPGSASPGPARPESG